MMQDFTRGDFLIPLILAVPLLGAIFVMCTPRTEAPLHRGIGLAFTLITFAISLFMISNFDPKADGFQLRLDVEWIPVLGAHFKTGVDGMSIFLVILTTFLMPLTLLGTGKAIEKNVREFIAAMLVLETGMIGAFVALDLFLFYVSWEVMLIPMYLLIGIWGGQRRLYASIKFVIYTMVGSLLMLVAILYVYVKAGAVLGGYTTDLEKLLTVSLPYGAQTWCFAAFALAFAIKVPLFPLHTWLPDAHVEAPTGGSIILAGVMLKMGTYGFLRLVLPYFPQASMRFAPLLIALAVIGIVYGALVAWVQPDMKKLVAYSSVSHLGFCVLGIFALNQTAIEGSILQMVNHGLSTGALFLLVGVIYERRHTRLLSDYGGIAKTMPVFTTVFVISVLSSAGLPGLNGFVGEFLILAGSFQSHPRAAVIAATGVILAAIYLLWLVQRVFFGPITNEANRSIPDIRWNELAAVVPLIVLMVWIGLYPNVFLRKMTPSVTQLLSMVKGDESKALLAESGVRR